MTTHRDALLSINKKSTAADKLQILHQAIRVHFPQVSRIAVALYDQGTDDLKTFVSSEQKKSRLTNYQAKLSETKSLQKMIFTSEPRVINDLTVLKHVNKVHSRVLLESGYLSSYTLPMIFNECFFGFVFFNSAQKNVFDERMMMELDMVAHMITLLIYNERSNIRTLLATVKSALNITHSRDPETAYHLERMSRYARLIAKELAQKHNFDDQYIEHLYLFAPLHDLGKIKVPDQILLKPGKLTKAEFDIMKNHSNDGKELIDTLLDNYGLSGVGHVDMLKNIAKHHHEHIDGSGYPEGLSGNDIPVEARIVAVADVFDALTSARPYKEAWSNVKAYNMLEKMAGKELDIECTEALLNNKSEIEEIQSTFQEYDLA